MVRTKGQIRNSKSKGRVFERDCEASLKQIDEGYYLTHEKGYIQQYDIRNDKHKEVLECKFHRSITWNEAKKWWQKLVTMKPTDYTPYLIFKSNQQPVLVMGLLNMGNFGVMEFTDYFGVPFIKHKPIRKFGKNFSQLQK